MNHHHKPPKSRRAEILKKVLDHFDVSDWYEGEDYLIFGPVATWLENSDDETAELARKILSGPGISEAEKEGRAILQEVRRNVTMEGDALSAQRTTMGDIPEPKSPFDIDKHSPQGIEAFLAMCEKIKQSRGEIEEFIRVHRSELAHGSESAGYDPQVDNLDARYAHEVVGKIAKIVSRVSRLDPFKAGKVPPPPVREYFREVHHCYLYGFRVACAVMCRAILEEALKETIDRGGVLERRVRGKGESYITDLVEKAERLGILADDRPEWAERIRKAGNWAVHDLEKFRREFPDDKFDEVLLNTRKILEDLYAARKTG